MAELCEVLITRAAAWTPDRKADPAHRLDLAQWRRLRAADDSLKAVDTLPGRNPRTHELVTVDVSHSAIWSHPKGYLVQLIWRDGELQAHGVDDLTVEKARGIATALGARVFLDVD